MVSFAVAFEGQKTEGMVVAQGRNHRHPIEAVSAMQDLVNVAHNQEVVPSLHFVDIVQALGHDSHHEVAAVALSWGCVQTDCLAVESLDQEEVLVKAIALDSRLASLFRYSKMRQVP